MLEAPPSQLRQSQHNAAPTPTKMYPHKSWGIRHTLALGSAFLFCSCEGFGVITPTSSSRGRQRTASAATVLSSSTSPVPPGTTAAYENLNPCASSSCLELSRYQSGNANAQVVYWCSPLDRVLVTRGSYSRGGQATRCRMWQLNMFAGATAVYGAGECKT